MRFGLRFCLAWTEVFVYLLDFGCGLPFEEITCLLADDIAVLEVVDLMPQRLDESEDDVVKFHWRVFVVLAQHQYLAIHSFQFEDQSVDDQLLLLLEIVFVEDVIEHHLDGVSHVLQSVLARLLAHLAVLNVLFVVGLLSCVGFFNFLFHFDVGCLWFGVVGGAAEELMVDFVFLVEYFQGEVVIFAEFLRVQFYLLQHAEVYYHSCSLTAAFLFGGQSFYSAEAVPVDPHFIGTADIPVFVGELSQEGIEFALFLEVSFVLGVGLVFRGDDPEFFLVVAVHGLADLAVVLRSDAFEEVAGAVVAFLLEKRALVDHPELLSNYNSGQLQEAYLAKGTGIGVITYQRAHIGGITYQLDLEWQISEVLLINQTQNGTYHSYYLSISRPNSFQICSTAQFMTERQQPAMEIIWWLVAKWSRMNRCVCRCSTRAPTKIQQKIDNTWSASSIHFSLRRPFRSQKRQIQAVMPSEQAMMFFILLMGDFDLARSSTWFMQLRYGCMFYTVTSVMSMLSMLASPLSALRSLRQPFMVRWFRQNLSLIINFSGLLPLRACSNLSNRYSLFLLYQATELKRMVWKVESRKSRAVTALTMFSSLEMNRLTSYSPQAKDPRQQQSQTASFSTRMNCFTLSTSQSMWQPVQTGSRQFFSTYTMNSRFILPNMQLTSDRCFSRIIVKVRKIYSSLAVCLEISRSLPSTEEMVSSTKERMDFLSMLLPDKTLAAFYILILALG